MFDVIVIGTGASGLFLSANLKGLSVLAIEKKDRPGRKILISGGGKCNLTNCDDTRTFLTHFRERKMSQFLSPSLHHFDTDATRAWFATHGLALEAREDGKVFPHTMDASSVVKTLYGQSLANGVSFRFDEPVSSVTRTDRGFLVQTEKDAYHGKTVVLATGGMSYPATGSAGDGYAIAKALGHAVVPPTPALVGISIDGYGYAKLAGNAVRGSLVEFFRSGEQKRYLQASGDLLFTHDGLSGPVIMNNARAIRKGDLLTVSLLPVTNKEEARKQLLALFSGQPRKQVYTLLKGLGICAPLALSLLAKAQVGKEETCANLHMDRRKRLAGLLLASPFVVSGKKGFSSAMVTAGGLALDEFDRKTMQSRKVPGFFATGEVLDIDGESGGYNIQAAFSTAMTVARTLRSQR